MSENKLIIGDALFDSTYSLDEGTCVKIKFELTKEYNDIYDKASTYGTQEEFKKDLNNFRRHLVDFLDRERRAHNRINEPETLDLILYRTSNLKTDEWEAGFCSRYYNLVTANKILYSDNVREGMVIETSKKFEYSILSSGGNLKINQIKDTSERITNLFEAVHRIEVNDLLVDYLYLAKPEFDETAGMHIPFQYVPPTGRVRDNLLKTLYGLMKRVGLIVENEDSYENRTRVLNKVVIEALLFSKRLFVEITGIKLNKETIPENFAMSDMEIKLLDINKINRMAAISAVRAVKSLIDISGGIVLFNWTYRNLNNIMVQEKSIIRNIDMMNVFDKLIEEGVVTKDNLTKLLRKEFIVENEVMLFTPSTFQASCPTAANNYMFDDRAVLIGKIVGFHIPDTVSSFSDFMRTELDVQYVETVKKGDKIFGLLGPKAREASKKSDNRKYTSGSDEFMFRLGDFMPYRTIMEILNDETTYDLDDSSILSPLRLNKLKVLLPARDVFELAHPQNSAQVMISRDFINGVPPLNLEGAQINGTSGNIMELNQSLLEGRQSW